MGGIKTGVTGTVAALWVAVALTTIAAAYTISYVGSISAPFSDEWRYTNPDIYLAEIFKRHHGHPFVIGKLALAVDYWWFDARGWALRAGALIMCAAQALAALVIFRASGKHGFGTQVTLTAVTAAIAFTPQAAQNLTWGFQFAFVTAFAAASMGVAALIAYAAAPKWWKLALASFLALVAALSLGNGILAPVVLLALAIFLRLPRNALAVLALVAAASIAMMVLAPGSAMHRVNPAHILDAVAVATRALGSGVATTLRFLGRSWGFTIEPLQVAFVVGVIQIVIAGAFSLLALFEREKNLGRMGAAGLVAFAVGSALLIGLMREHQGPQAAMASRYVAVGTTMWIAIAIFVMSYLPKVHFAISAAALTMSALLACLGPLSAAPLANVVAAQSGGRTWAQTALVTGNLVIGRALSPATPAGVMRRGAADLREHGKWLFQDRWSRSIGERLDAESAAVPACEAPGPFRVARPETNRFIGVRGRLSPALAQHGRIIVIAGARRVIRGYGLTARQPGDIWPFLEARPSAWFGYIRTTRVANERYTAYLASPDRVICRLGRLRNPATAAPAPP